MSSTSLWVLQDGRQFTARFAAHGQVVTDLLSTSQPDDQYIIYTTGVISDAISDANSYYTKFDWLDIFTEPIKFRVTSRIRICQENKENKRPIQRKTKSIVKNLA